MSLSIAFSSYITSTISLPELVWTLFSGIGLFYNLLLFREAIRDLFTLRKARINSIREYATVSNVLSEGIRTFVQFTFFTLGVVAMCIPAQNEHRIPTFQWVLTITFILLAGFLSCSAFLDRIRRKRLMSLILDYEDMK